MHCSLRTLPCLACARIHFALASTLKEIESNIFATQFLAETLLLVALSDIASWGGYASKYSPVLPIVHRGSIRFLILLSDRLSNRSLCHLTGLLSTKLSLDIFAACIKKNDHLATHL